MKGVGHGETLTQELGIPHQGDVSFRQPVRQVRGCADGDGGLAHHHRSGCGPGQQGGDGGVDIAEVRGPGIGLGSADSDEVQIHVGQVVAGGGGEPQPAGAEGPGEQLLETGFVERRPARRQRRHLGVVDIDSKHVMAEFGHAGGVNGPQVSATNNRDLHVFLLISRVHGMTGPEDARVSSTQRGSQPADGGRKA